VADGLAYDEIYMKSYVIGDVHGCLDELARLLEALPLESSDRLIFLGDYLDRGPDSKGVVSYLLERRRRTGQQHIFLKGNHEDMFLSYLGLTGSHGDMFLYNGGGATLASYGLPQREVATPDILSAIPSEHLLFFQDLKSYYLLEPYLCVHAGIDPRKPLDLQIEEEMLWIRDDFILNPHALPYTVLFGHTPRLEVLFDIPYKVGLDTGLVYGNLLSCLELEEKVLYQIRRGGKSVARSLVRGEWNQINGSHSM